MTMKLYFILLCLFCCQIIFGQPFFENLIGHWKGEAFGGELHSSWAKGHNGTFAGEGLFIENGDTTYRENLLFFELYGKQLLVAIPQDFPPFIFEVKTISENEIYFENTNHRNPQKIWYRLQEDDTFYRKTEGEHKDGTPSINEYFFKKSKIGN